jgi:hypothetical protein
MLHWKKNLLIIRNVRNYKYPVWAKRMTSVLNLPLQMEIIGFNGLIAT